MTRQAAYGGLENGRRKRHSPGVARHVPVDIVRTLFLACALLTVTDIAHGSEHPHHRRDYHLIPDGHYYHPDTHERKRHHPDDYHDKGYRPDQSHHKGYYPRYHHPHGQWSHKKKKDGKPPRSLLVDGRGKKRGTVKTIKEAIKRVAPGGTVVVVPRPYGNKSFAAGASGGYRESLLITKPVSLIGRLSEVADHSERVLLEPEPGQSCVVIRTTGTVFLRALDWAVPAGENAGGAPCIDVQRGRAVIEGVYVAGRSDGAAIRIASDKAVIERSEIANAGIGILLDLSDVNVRTRVTVPRGFKVSNNTIYKTKTAILVRGPHILSGAIGQPEIAISHNEIVKNEAAGIALENVVAAKVTGNTVLAGGADGLVLKNAGGDYTRNALKSNKGNGVNLQPSGFKASFADNAISGNGCGVRIGKGANAGFANDSLSGNKRCYCPQSRHRRKSIKLKKHLCHR